MDADVDVDADAYGTALRLVETGRRRLFRGPDLVDIVGGESKDQECTKRLDPCNDEPSKLCSTTANTMKYVSNEKEDVNGEH